MPTLAPLDVPGLLIASLPKQCIVDNGDLITISWSDLLLRPAVGGANPRNPGVPANYPAGLVVVSRAIRKGSKNGTVPLLRYPPLPSPTSATLTVPFVTGTLVYPLTLGVAVLPGQYQNYAPGASSALTPTMTATVGGHANTTLVYGTDFTFGYYSSGPSTPPSPDGGGESTQYDCIVFTPGTLPDNGTNFTLTYSRLMVEQGVSTPEYLEVLLHLYVSDLNGSPSAPDRGSTRVISAARLSPMLVSSLSASLDGLKGTVLGGSAAIRAATAATLQPTYGRLSFASHDAYAPALADPVRAEGPVHTVLRLMLHHTKMAATSVDPAIGRVTAPSVTGTPT